MSILTSASSSSVSRGYDYYNQEKVSSVMQLNDYEYEGYVDGSRNTPYYVKINTKHPRKSYCDCPHANGNITCKHMVALYFSLFQDEASDYEEWYESDYYDDYDDYSYYDDDENYEDYHYSKRFAKPLFFDMVIDRYVDELKITQLRKILKEELRQNEERTFELYLKNNYKKYIHSDDESFVLLENINRVVKDLTSYYDYNYNDFSKNILNIREKNH